MLGQTVRMPSPKIKGQIGRLATASLALYFGSLGAVTPDSEAAPAR